MNEQKKNFVIFQFPNLYLWVMIISWPFSRFATGLVQSVSRTVFITATIIWSYEEIVHGVNWFRKLLGAVVLGLTVVGLFKLVQ
jgi:hypothetical protein